MDHIAKATPVKRKDVPLLKLVENGASMPESLISYFLASVPDSSPQAPPLSPNYVQRGVMTDPMEFPTSLVSDLYDASGTVEDPGTSIRSPTPIGKDNQMAMKFTDMRGTPSPAPSLLPPSPGTGYLVRKMTHNTHFPVSPRRTPHASPHPHHSHQNASPEPPPTPNARDSMPCPSISVLAESDYTNSGRTTPAGAGAPSSSQDIVESQLIVLDDADNLLHDMDIDSVLMPGLDSQWQPQSQLPLRDSFDTSSLPSTIDPSQLHADNVEET